MRLTRHGDPRFRDGFFWEVHEMGVLVPTHCACSVLPLPTDAILTHFHPLLVQLSHAVFELIRILQSLLRRSNRPSTMSSGLAPWHIAPQSVQLSMKANFRMTSDWTSS